MLVENYGLKKDIAKGVVEIVKAGLNPTVKRDIYPRFCLKKEKESKIEEIKFKRRQKDVIVELAEQKERLKLAKVEAT